MLQFRLIVLLLFCTNKKSVAVAVDSEIETLKNRVTSLENEVSTLKTEKKELLAVKSDVSFLLEKNTEIMEILSKMGQNDQSNAISLRKTDNLSYLKTISGMHFHYAFGRFSYSFFTDVKSNLSVLK